MDSDVDVATDAKMMFLVRGCAYATLILSLYDWFTTLNFETLIIYSDRTDVRVKWLYCSSRYAGLVAQCVNALVVSFMTFHDDKQCRIWHSFQLVMSVILLLSLEITLTFRLHALYNCLSSLTRWLGIGLIVQSILLITFGGQAIHELSYDYDGNCIPQHAPKSVIYLAVTQLLTHTIIWIMTLYKYLIVYFNWGAMKIPLLTLIARDGLWVFVFFTALLSGIVADAARRERNSQASSLSLIIFPIYTALVSLSSCRITMNMRTFAAEVAPQQSLDTRTGSIELDTLFTSNEFLSVS